MKNNSKRLLCILMTLVLAFGFIPLSTVLADQPVPVVPEVVAIYPDIYEAEDALEYESQLAAVDTPILSFDIFNNGEGGSPSRPNASLYHVGLIRMWTLLNDFGTPLPYPNLTITATFPDGTPAMQFVRVNRAWVEGQGWQDHFSSIDVLKGDGDWEIIHFSITAFTQTVDLVLVNNRFVPNFEAARQAALDAIREANLPDANDFAPLNSDPADGYQIVIPYQNIHTWDRMLNTAAATYENTRRIYHAHMRLFSEWPAMGNPAIESEWGNVDATGIYALIDVAKAINPAWDIEADPDFANFVAFAAFHEPAARAGTVVATIPVHIGGVNAGTQETQAAHYERTGFESSFVPFRVFRAAIEIGQEREGQADIRVASFFQDALPHGGPGVTTMGCWIGMRVQSFVFDLNHEGIAIERRSGFLDVAQGYEIIREGDRTYVNLGDFQNVRIPVRPGARVFDFGGVAGSATLHTTITDMGLLENLPNHIGNTMYLMYCEDRAEVIQAHIRPGTRATRPVNNTTNGRFHYFFGVMPNDPTFGFDERMSPWPTDFALFDPTRFPAETGATDPDGRYPLFIYTGGIGHGLTKNTFANGGIPAASGAWQSQWENENPELSGAFVMMTRGTNNNRVGSIWGQCVITGKRGFSNPLFAEGDSAGQGRPTQAYPVIANVRRLLAENPNIDPNRIYVAGFSAGGYFTMELIWHAPDLFTAAKPSCPAFFPNNMARPFFDMPGKINEGDASGFLERMWNARQVPMWLSHTLLDTITPFYMTVQQPLHEVALQDPRFAPFSEMATFGTRFPAYMQTTREIVTIRGILEGFRHLEDGNPLTRVCVLNTGGHAQTNLTQNNLRTGSSTCPMTGRVEVPNFWARQYTPRPEAWVPVAGMFQLPVVGTAPVNIGPGPNPASLYTLGNNSAYSTAQGWYGTIVEWFNITGRQRQGTTKDVEFLTAEFNIHPLGGEHGYVTEIVLVFDYQPGDLLPEHITIESPAGTEVEIVKVTGRGTGAYASRTRNVVIEGNWNRGDIITITLEDTIGVTFVNGEQVVMLDPPELSFDIFNNGEGGSPSRPNVSLYQAGLIRMWTQLDGVNALVPFADLEVSAVLPNGQCAMQFVRINNMWANPGNVNLIDIVTRPAVWERIYLTATLFNTTVEVILVNNLF